MNFLYNSYDMSVSQAYIIHLPTNIISSNMAQRCLDSCNRVGQLATLYEGVDGTRNEIVLPAHLKNQSWIKWLKVTDHYQSIAEIACSLSHISLWVKCMEENKPLVILEHDAVMLKAFKNHSLYNSVIYLGCKDQLGNKQFNPTPPLSSINKNWNFINRAHAYSIDPAAARRLFTCVLDRGVYESADVMIKNDDVAIAQFDLYAYDDPGETTIKERKK